VQFGALITDSLLVCDPKKSLLQTARLLRRHKFKGLGLMPVPHNFSPATCAYSCRTDGRLAMGVFLCPLTALQLTWIHHFCDMPFRSSQCCCYDAKPLQPFSNFDKVWVVANKLWTLKNEFNIPIQNQKAHCEVHLQLNGLTAYL